VNSDPSDTTVDKNPDRTGKGGWVVETVVETAVETVVVGGENRREIRAMNVERVASKRINCALNSSTSRMPAASPIAHS